MAMKYGFKAYFIDPAYTTKIGEKLGKELGLDKHPAPAYALLIKALYPVVFQKLKNYYSF